MCTTYEEQALLVLLFHWFHVNAWNARWQWFLSIDELTTWYKSKKPSISYDHLFKTTFHKSYKPYLDFESQNPLFSDFPSPLFSTTILLKFCLKKSFFNLPIMNLILKQTIEMI